MFAPLKRLVQTNAFYTAVLLLILLVMKNTLMPYAGYEREAMFDWYDILLVSVVIVAGATSAISAYRYSLHTADSLYSATKTGLYSVLYTSLVLAIVSFALPMVWQQNYSNQLAAGFANLSPTISLVVFNLISILSLSSLGALTGFAGGLVGWVIGVLTVHGIIARDTNPEATDEDMIAQAVNDPTAYTYEQPSVVPQPIKEPATSMPEAQVNTPDVVITIPTQNQPPTNVTTQKAVAQSVTHTPKAAAPVAPAPETVTNATPLTQTNTPDDLTPLHFIHFIPEHDLQSLYAVGVEHVETLLERAGTHPTREALSGQTGIDPQTLLTYANVADLMRLPGVDSMLAQLMERTGVDSIVELGKRNPQNLFDALTTTNQNEAIAHTVPTVDQLRGLVNAAKMLSREITR